MEHFDIVLALARIALDGDGVRAGHQLERLREALAASDKDQAGKVARLLSRNGRRHRMAPMALDEMRATADAARRHLPGEALLPSTPLPHDRETGAPLAHVLFPDAIESDPPILSASLAPAIEDLLKRAEELSRIGARPNSRCLIYGPPGVGKTKLAHYLAKRLELTYFEARLDGLVSSFLGTTARNIGGLFDFANRYRCVLLSMSLMRLPRHGTTPKRSSGSSIRFYNRWIVETAAVSRSRPQTTSICSIPCLAAIHIPVPDNETRAKLLDQFVRPLRLRETERKFLV